MRKEEFCEILGDVNENYVKEARRPQTTARKPARARWTSVPAVRIRWAALTACLCLCLATAGVLLYGALIPQDFDSLVAKTGAGHTDDVIHATYLAVGSRIACYHEVSIDSGKLEAYVGEPYLQEDGRSWFYPSGVDNLKYLICREEEGNLSLWVFSAFLVTEDLSSWIFEGFTDPVTAPYTYGEVLETIYGVDSAEDIVSITTTPFGYNNADLGKKIQKEIGTHTYTDREDIAAFYKIIVKVTCLGTSSENPADSSRFTYSFFADGQERASIYATRKLTITLTDGTTIDSWNYTALSGSFFEYGSIFTEPLPEEAVYTLNEIFGIE